MLQLRDPATGALREVVPSRAGLLAVDVRGPGWRAYVTGDLVRRTAQLLGLRVRLTFDTLPSEALRYGIHPANLDDLPVERLDVMVSSSEVETSAPHRLLVAGDPPAAAAGLASRLVLLQTHYHEPVSADLEEAERELDSWRADVAAWAEEPSKPMCAEVQQGVLDAFCEDLDTPRALRVLRECATGDLPAGCKFETFAWADRLLGLDLARDVGSG